MSSPMRIHPELQRAADWAPKLTFSSRNLGLVRLLIRLVTVSRTPKDISVENIFIPGEDDGPRVRLRVYRPRSIAAPTPALLWLHGGGYVMGRPEMDNHVCAEYVRQLGISVFSVDYRNAPNHPFPAALNDSYSALKWVKSHAQQLDVDAKRIAVGGASAGGGLAAALAQLAHDRHEISPVFQLLVYPMLDDRTVLRTDLDDKSDIAWNRESNRFGWESYLGQRCGAENVPEYSVPARRQDLSGLPRAWIGVGSLDQFYDEDLAYAQKLESCGVECETVVVPGAFHGFDQFVPKASIVQDFRGSQISALEKCLLPSGLGEEKDQ